jgi:hypothetical protein
MSKTGTRKRFVLEAIDPSTECIEADALFEVQTTEELRAVIGPDVTEDDLVTGVLLDDASVASIVDAFGIAFDSKGLPTSLRPTSKVDDLPYKVHTNRELTMMLAGTKPFAFFDDAYPGTPGFQLPEHVFDPYVDKGLFSRREHIFPPQRLPGASYETPGIRYVMYALKGEEWRFEAFVLLQRTATIGGWSSGLERMLGSLLGYEDWQNDAFLKSIQDGGDEQRNTRHNGAAYCTETGAPRRRTAEYPDAGMSGR